MISFLEFLLLVVRIALQRGGVLKRAELAKSKAHKDSIGDAHLALPIVRCPHCGKSGRQGGAMRRHHFERCRGRRTAELKRSADPAHETSVKSLLIPYD